jgi:inner membrane protein involved in colicin E2 resistance
VRRAPSRLPPAAPGARSNPFTMRCANCGTEIADKAIVCFRCGQATVAPVRKPAQLKPSPWRAIASAVSFIILVLLALFLGRAGTIEIAPEIRYAVIGLAVVVLVWRLARRRR